MKHTLDIVAALKQEISLLERAYSSSNETKGSVPGDAHLKRISTLLSDLIREIEINGPSA